MEKLEKNEGIIIRIQGPIVDVSFPHGVPNIYEALEIKLGAAQRGSAPVEKGKLILELEDSRNMAGLFGTSELLEGKIHTPEDIIKKVDEVTSGDIQKIAKEIFVGKNLNLAVIGPFKDEVKFQQLLKL